MSNKFITTSCIIFSILMVVLTIIGVNEKVEYREQCQAKGGVFIDGEDRFHCVKKDSVLL